MKQRMLASLILSLLLTSCIFAATGGIKGKVIDSSDGLPVPYANVITEPPTASVTTNADGNYSISGLSPGDYRVIAIKPDDTSREVKVAVTAGKTTVADLHFGADDPPVISGANMLTNGGLDQNDFGIITNWANTGIDLHRWYLVQDIRPDKGAENARWIEWIELSEEGRGYGLKSTDHQNCNSFCSTSAVQIVPAVENRTYVLSAEAVRVEGKGGKIYIDFLNANRVRIKPHSMGGFGDEWSRQENTATAPAGTRFIRVVLYTDNRDQGVLYWDNVELRENQ